MSFYIMDETEYHQKADTTLNALLDFAEELEQNTDAEVEFDAGVLTLTMPDGRQYVINKHTPSRQIWVSSPYSGAGYFEESEGKWLPKRAESAAGRDLETFIKDEVNSHLN